MRFFSRFVVLVLTVAACRPGGPSEDDTSAETTQGSPPPDVSIVPTEPDLPSEPCSDGLSACEATARSLGDTCYESCEGLKSCVQGGCQTQCDLDTAEQLHSCATDCDAPEDVLGEYTCWSEGLAASIDCFAEFDCDPVVCDYMRYAGTLECSSSECFEFIGDFEPSLGCEFVLPLPVPLPMREYLTVEFNEEEIPLVSDCDTESGWLWADDGFDTMLICGDACPAYQTNGLTLKIRFDGCSANGRP